MYLRKGFITKMEWPYPMLEWLIVLPMQECVPVSSGAQRGHTLATVCTSPLFPPLYKCIVHSQYPLMNLMRINPAAFSTMNLSCIHEAIAVVITAAVWPFMWGGEDCVYMERVSDVADGQASQEESHPQRMLNLQ